MVAGWIDSVCLSFAWTLLLLEILDRHGLRAAGLAGAAMLVGVSLSAPVASRLSHLLSGCQLLRTAAAAEAVLRVGVFALLFLDVGIWVLASCVVVMNVTAWTGYAAMRAEVAAVAPGPAAITLYGTGVAAVEALGAAAAAVVPASILQDFSSVVLCIVVVYVLALLPTVLVAGQSPIPPGVRELGPSPVRSRPSLPLVAGVLLMAIASAPTLLYVPLAAELHGRSSVAMAAVAFTLGSLTAPYVAGVIERWGANGPLAWIGCAVGMVVLWPFAPLSITVLCVAQLLSGQFMTTLEGLLDARTAAEARGRVTGALARGTAGRALGSAAGTAALPFGLVAVGLSALTGTLALALLGGGVVAAVVSLRGNRALPGHVRLPDEGQLVEDEHNVAARQAASANVLVATGVAAHARTDLKVSRGPGPGAPIDASADADRVGSGSRSRLRGRGSRGVVRVDGGQDAIELAGEVPVAVPQQRPGGWYEHEPDDGEVEGGGQADAHALDDHDGVEREAEKHHQDQPLS